MNLTIKFKMYIVIFIQIVCCLLVFYKFYSTPAVYDNYQLLYEIDNIHKSDSIQLNLQQDDLVSKKFMLLIEYFNSSKYGDFKSHLMIEYNNQKKYYNFYTIGSRENYYITSCKFSKNNCGLNLDDTAWLSPNFRRIRLYGPLKLFENSVEQEKISKISYEYQNNRIPNNIKKIELYIGDDISIPRKPSWLKSLLFLWPCIIFIWVNKKELFS